MIVRTSGLFLPTGNCVIERYKNSLLEHILGTVEVLESGTIEIRNDMIEELDKTF
jgi:hypothetical protein